MSGRQNIEMEPAIYGGAVASREVARLRGLVAPLLQQNIVDPAGQEARLGGCAEDDARARPRRAGDLSPKLVQLLVRHPVLRIEQDVAVERSLRSALKVFGEGAVENFDPIGTRADR